MFGDAYPYKTDDITILPDNDMMDSLKERVKGKDPTLAKNLFWYRHNIWGTFVIAEWVGRPKDLYIDKMNLGKGGMGGLNREQYDELLKRCLDPMSAAEVLAMTAEEDSKWLAMQAEENAIETERLAKVARGE